MYYYCLILKVTLNSTDREKDNEERELEKPKSASIDMALVLRDLSKVKLKPVER
jgi:hypothetical protein